MGLFQPPSSFVYSQVMLECEDVQDCPSGLAHFSGAWCPHKRHKMPAASISHPSKALSFFRAQIFKDGKCRGLPCSSICKEEDMELFSQTIAAFFIEIQPE